MKRRIKKLTTFLTVFIVIFAMTSGVFATSISDIEEEKKDTESKKKEAEQILGGLKEVKDNILIAIQELDAKMTEYQTQITNLEAQKVQLEADIAVKEAELATAQEQEKTQYEQMKKRIQFAYENGNVDFLDTIFATSDLSDIMNKSEYVGQISKYDQEQLDELVELRVSIANNKVILENSLDDVVELEESLVVEKEALEILVEGKNEQLEDYEGSIEDYEGLIAQYEAEIAAQEAEMAAIYEKMRQAAAAGTTKVYYTGGTLEWPVSSGGYVTSPFGPRTSPVGRGQEHHNGIDIKCSTGTPILAAESGVVTLARGSSSAGNWIIIDHGGGMSTVYMHNSVLLVGVGDVVTRGQNISLGGSTGWSTGPHLHFEVRVNGVAQNPMNYFTAQ